MTTATITTATEVTISKDLLIALLRDSQNLKAAEEEIARLREQLDATR